MLLLTILSYCIKSYWENLSFQFFLKHCERDEISKMFTRAISVVSSLRCCVFTPLRFIVAGSLALIASENDIVGPN